MDDFPIKIKVLCSLSLACLMFGGMIGLFQDGVDDWIMYYYMFSPISTLLVGVVGIGLLADWLGIKNIRTCDRLYSGFIILICVSMLFHRDTWYLTGRIVAIFGATIAWLLSIDTSDKN